MQALYGQIGPEAAVADIMAFQWNAVRVISSTRN
jgi:hypothetical protein